MDDIYEVLLELGIEFEEYEHPPVYTVEEANRHRGKLPGGQTQELVASKQERQTTTFR